MFFRYVSKIHEKCIKSAPWRLQEPPKTPPGRPKTDFAPVLGAPLGAMLATFSTQDGPRNPRRECLGASWRRLGAFWRRLGASWRPRANKRPNKTDLGGLLGPSWPHFWEVFRWFSQWCFDHCLNLSLKASTCRKAKKYYCCNTGEALEAFRVVYF